MFKLINRRCAPPLEPLLFNQDLSRSNIGALFKGARGRRPSFTTVMCESHFSTSKPWFNAEGKTSGQNTMYGLLPPRLLYEHVPSHQSLITQVMPRVHPNDSLLTQQISCNRMFIRYLSKLLCWLDFFFLQAVCFSSCKKLTTTLKWLHLNRVFSATVPILLHPDKVNFLLFDAKESDSRWDLFCQLCLKKKILYKCKKDVTSAHLCTSSANKSITKLLWRHFTVFILFCACCM